MWRVRNRLAEEFNIQEMDMVEPFDCTEDPLNVIYQKFYRWFGPTTWPSPTEGKGPMPWLGPWVESVLSCSRNA